MGAHQGYYVVQQVCLSHIHTGETNVIDLHNVNMEMV